MLTIKSARHPPCLSAGIAGTSADCGRLLSGEHGLGFAFEVDVGIAADVDGDALDGAAMKACG